jgi:hypothetical protein
MKVLVIVTAIAALFGLGMIGGGVHLWVAADTGTKVVATVSECHTDQSGLHATTVCTGTWVIGGSLLNHGHVVLGTINGVGRSDIGKNIPVRVHGGTAYSKSRRLPIVLFVIGGLALLTAVWFIWAGVTGRAFGPATRAAMASRSTSQA